MDPYECCIRMDLYECCIRMDLYIVSIHLAYDIYVYLLPLL